MNMTVRKTVRNFHRIHTVTWRHCLASRLLIHILNVHESSTNSSTSVIIVAERFVLRHLLGANLSFPNFITLTPPFRLLHPVILHSHPSNPVLLYSHPWVLHPLFHSFATIPLSSPFHPSSKNHQRILHPPFPSLATTDNHSFTPVLLHPPSKTPVDSPSSLSFFRHYRQSLFHLPFI